MSNIVCIDPRGKEYSFDETEYIERPSVYGICIQNGEILLTKDTWSQKWGIPGGGIDEKETVLQAIQREFLEETGFVIASEVEKLWEDVTYFLGDGESKPWKVIRTICKVNPIGGSISNGIPGEVEEVKYIAVKEAIELLEWYENNRSIADYLKSLL